MTENIRPTTLRPGFLVSLKTAMRGNVTYQTRDIEPDHTTADGERRALWETTRIVADPAEHEAGVKARSAARTAIARVCSNSNFGLLCPEARQTDLADAIADARRIAADFNRDARCTQLYVGVIVGRVASDDADAIRAINEEVRALIDEMGDGITRLDVAAVRDAASRAKALGQMLSPDAASKVADAIDAARGLARRMVKAGETAAQEIDAATLAALASARTAFLDLEEPTQVAAPTVTAEPRALDLDPTPPPAATVAPVYVAAPQLELI